MSGHEVSERYGRFARDEAPGRSQVYEQWALAVAHDAAACAVIARLPPARRQPPLVFAVARMRGAPLTSGEAFVSWLGAHADEVVAAASSRSVQTNEPLRCAALLPALSLIDGPIALLEVGASAGLCLYPDRYAYRYRGAVHRDLDPSAGSKVVLHCEVRGDTPRLELPQVVWRAGIDLSPLDAADAEDRGFLTALVWPGETGRAERIEAALDVAAADPPLLAAGDATDAGALATLAARAPRGATLVVTTPGVLPHIPRTGRERLFAHIDALGARWVSIDPVGTFAPAPQEGSGEGGGRFALRLDRAPLAICDPLGGWLEWLPGSASPAG